MCTQLASRTEPPRPPPRPGLVRLAGGGNHTCLINLKAGPRRHPGYPARPRSFSPTPQAPSPVKARSRCSSPGPSDSHPPGYTALDPDPASAPAPPPPPPALQPPARQPLRELRPRRGSTYASSPPLPAYAGRGADPRRRPRAEAGRDPEAGGGAGPAAGVSTWGGGKDVPEAPPARAQPADPDLDQASPPRSLRRSLRAQRLGLSGNILPRSQLSTSYGTLECKTRWPPEPGEQVASSGQKLQKPGMRHAHELLSGKYQ
nr:uncharacterized protein LOC116153379 [Camelus dromedarius]